MKRSEMVMNSLLGLVFVGAIVVGILYAVGVIPSMRNTATLSHIYGVGITASAPTMAADISGKKALSLTFLPTVDGVGGKPLPDGAELEYMFALVSEDRKTVHASGHGRHPTKGEPVVITHDLKPTDSGHLAVEASIFFKDGSKSMTGSLTQDI